MPLQPIFTITDDKNAGKIKHSLIVTEYKIISYIEFKFFVT